MIKAISLDGDDTLWDFDSAMRASIRIALARLRELAGDPWLSISVEQVMAIRDRIADERGEAGPSNTLDEIRRASFEEVAQIAGLDSRTVGRELSELYFRSVEETGKLFPDAEPAVAELRRNYKAGLVTNGNSSPARFGSEMQLDFIVRAQDAGLSKPDPRIFHLAAEQAGCQPTELAHVGDALETDILGALNAGATAIHLNRRNYPNPTAIQPHHTITTLAELPALIAQIYNTS